MVLFTNPSARARYDTRSIFKRSLTGLNSEFSFSLTSCLTKAEEHSLSYYLPIAGGRIIGFIPFPRVLVLCEMQSDGEAPVKEYSFIAITPVSEWYNLLGSIYGKWLVLNLEDLEVSGRIETIRTTALLRTARILRRVL